MSAGEWQLLLIPLLIIVNGFFALSEIALVTMRPTQVTTLVERGVPGARRLARLYRNPSRFFSTIQVAITLSGFLASASATLALADPLASLIQRTGLASGWAQTVAVVLVTSLVSYLSLVFGELVPKQLALQSPQSLALRVARPVELLGVVLHPFVAILSASTGGVLKLFGVNQREGRTRLSEDELRRLVSEHRTLTDGEKEMIQSVFDFGDLIVREVMVPRGQVVALEAGATVQEAANLVRRTGFSRFPVYDGDLDHIRGIVTVKDVLYALLDGRGEAPVGEVCRDTVFVPEVKNTFVLLQELRRRRSHMVVVTDEYGGTAGVATVEDLLEEIVGDIQDETDPESDASIVPKSENVYIVDAGLRIEEVNASLHIDLATGEGYETLAGYMLDRLQKIPRESEVVDVGPVRLRIAEMDQNRIAKVEVTKTAPPEKS